MTNCDHHREPGYLLCPDCMRKDREDIHYRMKSKGELPEKFPCKRGIICDCVKLELSPSRTV